MSNWNRSKWGWFFAPDEKAGGSPSGQEEEPAATEEGAAEEETKEESEGSEEDSEDQGSEERTEEETPPEPKVRDLTDEEIAERAKALGFVKPEPAKEETPDPKAQGLEVPDFRRQAYEEVANAPNAQSNGWVDEDGDLTDAGQRTAENHALMLAADHRMKAVESEREKLEIQANRGQYAEQNVKFLRETFEFEEGEAQSIGKTMTDILVDSYGAAALKPKTQEEAEIAKRLFSTAYYTALGIETHNARVKAAKEGPGKGDTPPPEKPSGSRGGEGVLAGLDKADRDWIEKDYIPRLVASKGGDYKPTKADYEKAKELINR